MIILLSGIALLLLASSLLADDGSRAVSDSTLPDTATTQPVSLVGITTSFNLEDEPDFKHSPVKSVLFSSVLPGMGQANNGRWAKASAFVVVGSLLISKIVVESERADRYLYLSRSATTNEDAEAFYDEYTNHFNRRDSYIWWTVGFWLYNMLDAYIDGHLFGFSRQ
jgi:hypothetical protein